MKQFAAGKLTTKKQVIQRMLGEEHYTSETVRKISIEVIEIWKWCIV